MPFLCSYAACVVSRGKGLPEYKSVCEMHSGHSEEMAGRMTRKKQLAMVILLLLAASCQAHPVKREAAASPLSGLSLPQLPFNLPQFGQSDGQSASASASAPDAISQGLLSIIPADITKNLPQFDMKDPISSIKNLMQPPDKQADGILTCVSPSFFGVVMGLVTDSQNTIKKIQKSVRCSMGLGE